MYASSTRKFLIIKLIDMTKERFKWYKAEIARLRELDKRISDRVRASYAIPTKLAKSLKEVQ